MPNSEPRHFFKVFFPDQSSNSLRIPRAFWGHIGAEVDKRVALKGQSGSIWRVKLVKNSDGFVFDDGWKEFVDDQSLVLGDFLIFRYNGKARFEVLVFDATACEKKKAFAVRPSAGEEIEDDEGEELREDVAVGTEEEDDEYNRPLVHFAKKRFDGSSKGMKGMTDALARNNHSMKKKKRKLPQLGLIIPKQEYESYSPSISSKPIQGTIQKNREIVHRDSPFSIRCRRIETRLHNTTVSGSSSYPCKVSIFRKPDKVLALGDSTGTARLGGSTYRLGSLISQRQPVTEEEVKSTLQRAMSFKSENPFALAVMQDSYVYTSFFMSLPSWFAREHLPKMNTVMTVWDPTPKPWKITYISYNTHGALSGGWGKFSYANNLEKHDVCVFELIQQDHLKVHIYRVVEELTPLIRRRSIVGRHDVE